MKISTPLRPLGFGQLHYKYSVGWRHLNVHFDVGAIWRKELLASLGSQAGINSRENNIANRDLATTLKLLDSGREKVLLDVSRSLPRRKEAHLAEVSIVGKVKLWPKADNLAVEDNGACVIPTVAVKERKANIKNNAVQRLISQNRVERVPRVFVHLTLEEVVQTPVSRNLQLGSNAQRRARLLGLVDALFDPPEIIFIVQSPLVEGTCCNSDKMYHDCVVKMSERNRKLEEIVMGVGIEDSSGRSLRRRLFFFWPAQFVILAGWAGRGKVCRPVNGNVGCE